MMKKMPTLLAAILLLPILFLNVRCRSIHRAVLNGDIEEVEELLKEGTDINAVDRFGFTPLHWAVYYHNLAMARLLLQKGADPNIPVKIQYLSVYGGNTPLITAAYYGKHRLVALLLQYRARSDVENNMGDTALSYARYYRFEKCVKLLE